MANKIDMNAQSDLMASFETEMLWLARDIIMFVTAAAN